MSKDVMAGVAQLEQFDEELYKVSLFLLCSDGVDVGGLDGLVAHLEGQSERSSFAKLLLVLRVRATPSLTPCMCMNTCISGRILDSAGAGASADAIE